jgi:DNA repair exonuclease SbcCD ATPase subunit
VQIVHRCSILTEHILTYESRFPAGLKQCSADECITLDWLQTRFQELPDAMKQEQTKQSRLKAEMQQALDSLSVGTSKFSDAVHSFNALAEELTPLIEPVALAGDRTASEVQDQMAQLKDKCKALLSDLTHSLSAIKSIDEMSPLVNASIIDEISSLYQQVLERLLQLQSPVDIEVEEDKDGAQDNSKVKDVTKRKQEKNKYAVGVWRRIRGKLEGLLNISKGDDVHVLSLLFIYEMSQP